MRLLIFQLFLHREHENSSFLQKKTVKKRKIYFIPVIRKFLTCLIKSQLKLFFDCFYSSRINQNIDVWCRCVITKKNRTARKKQPNLTHRNVELDCNSRVGWGFKARRYPKLDQRRGVLIIVTYKIDVELAQLCKNSYTARLASID